MRCSDFRALIAALTSRHASFSDEFDRLLAAFRASCLSKVAELARYGNQHRRRLCHVPPEMWLAIWTWLPIHDVITISHVCRKWRELAVRDPSLWASFEVAFDLHHSSCGRGRCRDRMFADLRARIQRASAVLSRSGSLPLTIYITVSGDPIDYAVAALADALIPHAPRIERLGVYSSSSTIAAVLSALPPLPELHTLHMSSFQCMKLHPLLLLLPGYKKLQRLTLPPATHWRAGRDQPFPLLAQVRELRCTPFTLADFWPTLSTFTGLRVLYIDVACTTGTILRFPSAIYLCIQEYCSQLEGLSVSGLPLTWRWGDLGVQLFAHQALDRLALEYNAHKPACVPGLNTLAHVVGDVDCVLTVDGRCFTIEVRNETKSRRIVIRDARQPASAFLASLWAGLTHVTMRKLSIDWTLRETVIGNSALLPLTDLTLILPPHIVLTGDDSEHNSLAGTYRGRSPTTSRLPEDASPLNNLRDLRFELRTSDNQDTVSAGCIANFALLVLPEASREHVKVHFTGMDSRFREEIRTRVQDAREASPTVINISSTIV